MTSKEKKVYTNWSKIMSTMTNGRNRYFKEMQELYERRGGGKATCSLEYNLAYLLTSNDVHTRDRALAIYANYMKADGQNQAFMELGQELANVK